MRKRHKPRAGDRPQEAATRPGEAEAWETREAQGPTRPPSAPELGLASQVRNKAGGCVRVDGGKNWFFERRDSPVRGYGPSTHGSPIYSGARSYDENVPPILGACRAPCAPAHALPPHASPPPTPRTGTVDETDDDDEILYGRWSRRAPGRFKRTGPRLPTAAGAPGRYVQSWAATLGRFMRSGSRVFNSSEFNS
jgi:hypothetical protein